MAGYLVDDNRLAQAQRLRDIAIGKERWSDDGVVYVLRPSLWGSVVPGPLMGSFRSVFEQASQRAAADTKAAPLSILVRAHTAGAIAGFPASEICEFVERFVANPSGCVNLVPEESSPWIAALYVDHGHGLISSSLPQDTTQPLRLVLQFISRVARDEARAQELAGTAITLQAMVGGGVGGGN